MPNQSWELVQSSNWDATIWTLRAAPCQDEKASVSFSVLRIPYHFGYMCSEVHEPMKSILRKKNIGNDIGQRVSGVASRESVPCEVDEGEWTVDVEMCCRFSSLISWCTQYDREVASPEIASLSTCPRWADLRRSGAIPALPTIIYPTSFAGDPCACSYLLPHLPSTSAPHQHFTSSQEDRFKEPQTLKMKILIFETQKKKKKKFTYALHVDMDLLVIFEASSLSLPLAFIFTPLPGLSGTPGGPSLRLWQVYSALRFGRATEASPGAGLIPGKAHIHLLVKTPYRVKIGTLN
ncbi:uncharacterized protein CLUP02_05285 [Colletotrichum lupini]|uniref:Uncharacterized protein n=1 Tax=Colletotrichum lupini TaxID=145971 RepID=A0A9Q8WEM3_9PEZI|nr:uncharacterized protein CLUP02_05285 [Colletotrichum lupini]UQC79805.1 hypothetical protein CLUP02_05285 [Colletotrichum lupini]